MTHSASEASVIEPQFEHGALDRSLNAVVGYAAG